MLFEIPNNPNGASCTIRPKLAKAMFADFVLDVNVVIDRDIDTKLLSTLSVASSNFFCSAVECASVSPVVFSISD